MPWQTEKAIFSMHCTACTVLATDVLLVFASKQKSQLSNRPRIYMLPQVQPKGKPVLEDPEKKKKSLTAEINNGRLAMMAIIGDLAEEAGKRLQGFRE